MLARRCGRAVCVVWWVGVLAGRERGRVVWCGCGCGGCVSVVVSVCGGVVAGRVDVCRVCWVCVRVGWLVCCVYGRMYIGLMCVFVLVSCLPLLIDENRKRFKTCLHCLT